MHSQQARNVVAPATVKTVAARGSSGRAAPKPLDASQLKHVSGGTQSEGTSAPHKGW